MLNRRGTIQVWDVPPYKPLAQFILAAATLALPFAWLAHRRSRLRSSNGFTA
jgi:hypothetical protein